MVDSYLYMAREVIKAKGRPLSVQEILAEGEVYGLVPKHLHGKTMHKTLHARISEDIDIRRFKSDFYRTSPGYFFLRELSDDPYVSSIARKEYFSEKRKRSHRSSRVLTIEARESKNILEIREFKWCMEAVIRYNAKYSHRTVFSDGDDVFCFASFLIITNMNNTLIHKIGKYSEYKYAYGFQSVGFRSFITEFDVDLFDMDAVGVYRSALREALRHIIVHDVKAKDTDLIDNMKCSNVIIDGLNRMIAPIVVLNMDEFDFSLRLKSRCLDINQPMWKNIKDLKIGNFDTWSKLILEAI
jgi:hypothetical protein